MKRGSLPPVTMPAKTTRKKGPGDSVYIYLTTRAYRNAAGKPTSDEAMIGKLAPDGLSLIPNQRYFEFFPPEEQTSAPAAVISLGASAAMHLLADKLGISTLLGKVFPDKHAKMLTIASFMTGEGCIMAHIGDWCELHYTTRNGTVDSQSSSDLFASLKHNDRLSFLSGWIARITEDDYIAYDVTSLSTYSLGIEDAEWGHNRDGEDLTQINLGMFLGEKSRLPAYYATYQGSVLDKTHLPIMLDSAGALGITRVRFVFDRGFVTTENLAYVAREHLSFITALPQSLKDFKELIAGAGSRGITGSRNSIGTDGLYAVSSRRNILGTMLTAHVFYSPQKRALEEEALYARVGRLETELMAMKRMKKLPKRYSELFKIESGGNAVVSFTRDFDKIDTRLAQKGYFVLATNDERLTSAEVLRIYRNKDVIEKAFSGMKNQLDLKRMRTHSSRTTDGKLFCGFIALVLHMAVREALGSAKETEKMSVESALRELGKLKRITYPNGSIHHTAVTKTQRLVLSALGIKPEDILTIK